jgi:UDP-N-acetylmuramoyl-L-alanyl-D-glutamate--2,6-diaminopimelate ligase
MKSLQNILKNVSVVKVSGEINLQVNALVFDSRKVTDNDVFVAQKGLLSNGHNFIQKAINNGAKVIVYDDASVVIPNNVTSILVSDSNKALAVMASNFYDNPSSRLKLVGITGTNGKTTIATLLFNLFKEAKFKVGLLSTVVVKIDNEIFNATHTTPDSVTINKYLAAMVEKGITHCFMEVSSHGIHQKRTYGLTFAGGIFTNLSHDHLDYHKTFAEYRDIKKQFFDSLPKKAFALVNIDDKNGKIMLQNTKAIKRTYALKTLADYKTKVLENSLQGMLLQINGQEVWTKLIGYFNAYNVTAIYGVAVELGLEKTETLRLISQLDSVSGRFQYVTSKNGVVVIVDYAHTPDALKNVLQTIESIKNKSTQIITVVGCGGDRDKAKRPKMGFIASHLSDQAIFTSDNPRTENPELIIEEMEVGITEDNQQKVLSIVNRKQAIKTAIKLANSKDIILIAGKGHENYQEINGVKHHFDDLEIVKELLKIKPN